VGSHMPFTCRDVEICAAALLDEQLSPAEEEMVAEHLDRCDACADMIDAMDAQRLKPPRLQILQDNDYWEEMDAVLQAELDKAESEQPKLSKQSMFLYAAVLLLTLLWGWHHRQRALHLERIVFTQQQTLEQLERVSTPTIQNDGSGQQVKVKAVYRPAKMEL
jgi:anti-sigma factor RsiW